MLGSQGIADGARGWPVKPVDTRQLLTYMDVGSLLDLLSASR